MVEERRLARTLILSETVFKYVKDWESLSDFWTGGGVDPHLQRPELPWTGEGAFDGLRFQHACRMNGKL